MRGLIKALSIFFAIHGALYFCLGVGVDYREETWVKYVKYALAMACPLLLWNKVTTRRFLAFIAQNTVFGALLFARVVWNGLDVEMTLFLNFFFSSLLLLVPVELLSRRDWLDVIGLSGAFTIGFAVVEFLFLQNVNACNDLTNVYGYYRVGSCYLSFNTCGAVLALSCIAYLYGFNIGWRPKLSAILFVCSGLVIVLTGSRAALLAYLIVFSFAILKLNFRYKRLLVFAFFVLAVAFPIAMRESEFDGEGIAVNRTDAAESTDMRAEQLTGLLDAASRDIAFPRPNTEARSDCGWIQLYYDFGLLGVMLEGCLFMLLFCRCSSAYERMFVVLFAWFMVTQVAVYLFPFAYVFMAFISYKLLIPLEMPCGVQKNGERGLVT